LEDSNGAVVGIALGGFVLVIALLILTALIATDDLNSTRILVPAFISLLGGSLIAGSAMALPKWAREQERRMEHISNHAVSLLALPGSTDD
jgi:hypothetical protein